MNQILFENACEKVIHSVKTEKSIGIMKEKTVHAVLKEYYSLSSKFQEVKVNSFIADIFDGNEIIEIQTRNFNTMRRKLVAYLPDYPVTIVYPIAHTKTIRWINRETGEVSKPRKSPKTGSAYQVFPELYKIKNLLTKPNLSIKLVFVDVEEYKYLDGWSFDKKRGATKVDQIPVALCEELLFRDYYDYVYFLPEALPEEFTSKDLAAAAKISRSLANVSLNILYYLGTVERVGKKNNFYLYSKKEITLS